SNARPQRERRARSTAAAGYAIGDAERACPLQVAAFPRMRLAPSCLALACVLAAGPALAQQGSVEPPRVVELDEIELEGEGEVPASVEGRARISEEGVAALESCDAGAAVCEALARVIARGRFEPARRDGRSVP